MNKMENKNRYCIMNVDKQRRSAVYGLQIEANRQADDDREFDRSDIDREKTADNIFLRKTENWNKEITQQIKEAGCAERSNSVVMITGVYTASPAWFEEHSKAEALKYFEACLKFHDQTYGRAFNAVIHLDEKTPHMQVASVPIVEDEKGKHLSAKIVMGNRGDYRMRQDRFYEEVGKTYDMERGERLEPAEIKAHTTKREWQLATQAEKIAENQHIIERQEAQKAQNQQVLREQQETRLKNDEITRSIASKGREAAKIEERISALTAQELDARRRAEDAEREAETQRGLADGLRREIKTLEAEHDDLAIKATEATQRLEAEIKTAKKLASKNAHAAEMSRPVFGQPRDSGLITIKREDYQKLRELSDGIGDIAREAVDHEVKAEKKERSAEKIRDSIAPREQMIKGQERQLSEREKRLDRRQDRFNDEVMERARDMVGDAIDKALDVSDKEKDKLGRALSFMEHYNVGEESLRALFEHAELMFAKKQQEKALRKIQEREDGFGLRM